MKFPSFQPGLFGAPAGQMRFSFDSDFVSADWGPRLGAWASNCCLRFSHWISFGFRDQELLWVVFENGLVGE